jgi:hypothetical protein
MRPGEDDAGVLRARRRRSLAARPWRGALLALLAGALTAGAGPAVATADAGRATPRIIGGGDVAITAVPYQVALWNPTRGTPLEGQFCGGVVLSATKVATAGHCVHDAEAGGLRPTTSIRVLAGTSHLRGASEPAYGPGVRDVAVSSIALHPSYDPTTADFDAAVLTLAEPLYAGSPAIDGVAAIAPIELLPASQSGSVTAYGALLQVSGWGDTSGGSTYPADLRATNVRVADQQVCGLQYLLQGGVTDRMLCATANGQDSCGGDSGGPLTGTVGGTRVLAGLVSFGLGCANGVYGVYTRVASTAIGSFLRSAAGLPAAGTSTPPAPAPTPAAPAPDVAAPTSRVARRTCTRVRCTVRVTVSDALPTAGVARVTGTLRWTTRRACRRDGRRTTCAVRQRRTLRASLVGGTTWALRTPRLAKGVRYRLTVTARDRAGNVERRPRAVTLRRRA